MYYKWNNLILSHHFVFQRELGSADCMISMQKLKISQRNVARIVLRVISKILVTFENLLLILIGQGIFCALYFSFFN